METSNISNGVFDPRQIALLQRALKIACAHLEPNSIDALVRSRLASIILQSAHVGFRDPQSLAKVALNQLTISAIARMEADCPTLTPSPEQSHQFLKEIAADVLTDWGAHTPRDDRASIAVMAKLTHIGDDADYDAVSQVRRSLNPRRSLVAVRVKRELEMMVSHYRADHW